MLKTEIASAMEQDGLVYEISSKTKYNKKLTEEEKDVAEVVDAWAKEIGEKGSDPDNELSAFIIKTLEPVVYDIPDALLDTLFDRGTIGEFDDEQGLINPKNTLKVYDATKGGNVPKSYIDYTEIKPVWKHKQIETEISYMQLRRNGFKTTANLIVFMEEALKNKMFMDIIDAVDNLITASNTEQYFTTSGLTQSGIDEVSLYLLEHGTAPFMLCRTKYAQAIARMTGQNTFMSDAMKDDFNRYGLVPFIDGVRVAHIPSVIKANEVPVMPDGKIFGFSDKIGTIDMRGALRMYEDFDNKSEKVELKLTGFEYGMYFEKPENTCKLVITD
jgi:hypothetical protein